jgi:prepilin-type N-terminal cleavage/methylation domain-containing protein
MKKISNAGFTLVEVMIAIAIVSGISLVVMQLTQNASNSQANMSAFVDFIDIRGEIEGILSDPKDCTASFANTNFNGSTINATPVPVEIWHGDQNGVRTRKKFSSTDSAISTIGKVTLTDLSLSMPDYTAGTNFPPGPGSFKAELTIVGTKKIAGKESTTKKITKTVYLNFVTNASGVSTIMTCSLVREKDNTIPKQGFCTPQVLWDNNNVGVCPPVTGYTTTRISACIPGTIRSLTCCYIPANDDSNGWCSSSMEGHGGCFSGCGSGSPDYDVDHINGRSSGSNDSHICCFVPRNHKATRPFASSHVDQWDSFSGCNPHPNYKSLRIEVVTAGKGHQSSCTFVPE